MTQTTDYLLIGGGLYGAATAFNLARLGASNVTLLERGSLCSGGTAKSCAIVRTHYSIPENMAHAVESLKIFANFAEVVGGDAGFRRTGYLILGPEAHREPMLKVFAEQNRFGVDTRVVEAEEARELHPLLQLDDVEVIGYDTLTGYCDPYLTTTSYANRARDLGVDVRTDTPVTTLTKSGSHYRVETPSATFETPNLILAAGPHTNRLLSSLGVKLPYEISRHQVITLRIGEPYRPDWPIVKDLTSEDKLYFRPDSGGVVLIGTGDHGDPLDDPDTLTDAVDPEHITRIGERMTQRMPAFAEAEYVNGWTGPYDIPPDWNPMVGPVPSYNGLHVAVGFSGHGFKLAPTVGEALAQTVLGQAPRISIEAYRLSRFNEGQALHGAYGIGSIS